MTAKKRNRTTRAQPPVRALPVKEQQVADAVARRQWRWFRQDRDARPKAREEFDRLPPEARAALVQRMERYASGESRAKDVDHLGDGIYELRCRCLNNQFRVLFMHWGTHCVALTAFYKNQQATPKQDLKRAKARARRWREVFGETPEA